MAAKGSLTSIIRRAKQSHFFVCSIGRRISGETLETLKEFSRRGMNSSGKACQPLIAEASSRTGLSEQQVKVSPMLRNSYNSVYSLRILSIHLAHYALLLPNLQGSWLNVDLRNIG